MGTKKEKSNANFLLQGSILAVAGIITKIIGMVYRIPLNNILGDEGQGFYGYAFEIYNIALLLTSYSLPLAVSKLVAARMATGEKKNAFRLFKCALLFALGVGVSVSLIIFFGADFIATHIMSANLSVYALRVLAPCLLVVAVMGVLRGYFQGLGTMIPTAVSQILEQIVNAIISIVGASYLFKMGAEVAKAKKNPSFAPAYGAAGGTLGTLMGAVAGLIFLILVYKAYSKTIKKQMKRDHSGRLETYSEIFPVLLLTIAPVILSTAIYNITGILDSTIFSKIMSVQGATKKEYVELLGMYSGKYNTMIHIPLAVANSLAASMIPSITAAVTSGNKKLVHNRIQLVTRFSMLIAIPSAVGLCVLAEPILKLLYGTGNIAIPAMMLRIGAVTVIFYCLSTVTNATLQGVNKMSTPAKNASISLAIHIAALLVFLIIFKVGVYSIVLSNIVFSLSMCILNSKALRQATGYHQEYQKTFVIPIMAAVIMGVVAFASHLVINIFTGNAIATLLAILFAGIAYGLGLLLLGGLSEDDILAMPKGATLVTILRRFHLLKEEYY